MLTEDLTAPRKQRHTARRVFARLADEHGATELSYSTVRNYVRARRPEIEADRRQEVFIPQEHAPGAEAEVDFGEVWVILAGVKTKCHMFTFRLSASGRAVHRVYATQGQEAFLEGHIEAFEEIGGIPTRHINHPPSRREPGLDVTVIRASQGSRDVVGRLSRHASLGRSAAPSRAAH